MAYPNEETINFNELEVELQKIIDNDIRYWKENDAKFRAVNQGVPTYEDFREMVNAAHLTPLAKEDRLDIKQKSIWNTLASSEGPASLSEQTQPDTYYKFHHQWCQHYTNNEQRYRFLCELGLDKLMVLFQGEPNFVILGQVVQCLLLHGDKVEEIAFTIRLLQILTKTGRFALTLEFLNADEKQDCRALFSQLKTKFHSHEQDLAEMGITEWTLQELLKIYNVF